MTTKDVFENLLFSVYTVYDSSGDTAIVTSLFITELGRHAHFFDFLIPFLIIAQETLRTVSYFCFLYCMILSSKKSSYKNQVKNQWLSFSINIAFTFARFYLAFAILGFNLPGLPQDPSVLLVLFLLINLLKESIDGYQTYKKTRQKFKPIIMFAGASLYFLGGLNSLVGISQALYPSYSLYISVIIFIAGLACTTAGKFLVKKVIDKRINDNLNTEKLPSLVSLFDKKILLENENKNTVINIYS